MAENSLIKLADGRIVGWHGSNGKLEVGLIDWQEKPLLIRFNQVVAALILSPESVDLSHLERVNNDALLNQVRAGGGRMIIMHSGLYLHGMIRRS